MMTAGSWEAGCEQECITLPSMVLKRLFGRFTTKLQEENRPQIFLMYPLNEGIGGQMLKRTTSILLFILLSACQAAPAPDGMLKGHVSIGPILPAIQEGVPEPTPDSEMYAARQIVIFDQNGRKEIARASINAVGDYEISLPAAAYIVDINHSGVDFAKGLPAQVEIRPYEVTRLDIAIDTGIR